MESKNTPAPIPDRYRRVTPSLIVNDAAKALEFYGDVFGATERMRFPGPGGTIAHAEVEIGDSVVMVEDESGHGWTVVTHVEDVPPDEMMRRLEALMKEAG